MSEFRDAAKKVKRFRDNIEDDIDRAVEDSMEDVVTVMQLHLLANRSIATGRLFGSLRVIDTGAVNVRSFSEHHIVGFDWWKYLEYGTGIYTSRTYKAPSPGAPFEKIYAWILAKGEFPDPGQPADTQEELAHMIANSVSSGTESHPFVRPAWRGPRGKRHVVSSVKRAARMSMKRSL